MIATWVGFDTTERDGHCGVGEGRWGFNRRSHECWRLLCHVFVGFVSPCVILNVSCMTPGSGIVGGPQ